jgi:hypothetical protein
MKKLGSTSARLALRRWKRDALSRKKLDSPYVTPSARFVSATMRKISA